MEFKINNTQWTIEEVDEATINNEMKQDGTLGVTIYKTQEILLLESQANIIKTLKHELVHVWLYEYGHNQGEKEFNCEDVCEIVASSNDFINEIVKQFLQDKQVCHVENKDWNNLSKEEQEKILKRIREQPIQKNQLMPI